MEEETRLEWLIARHVESGKAPAEAEAWVMRSDQSNAEVVGGTRGRADLIVRLG
jgi:pantothenate kinase